MKILDPISVMLVVIGMTGMIAAFWPTRVGWTVVMTLCGLSFMAVGHWYMAKSDYLLAGALWILIGGAVLYGAILMAGHP
jgi:hypothetical protein